MLVNLGQHFFDNSHSDRRSAYQETQYFLKVFWQFSTEYLTPDSFQLNALGNLEMKNYKDIVFGLFEGLTRQETAHNYLKYVFQQAFTKVDLLQVEKDL